MKKHDVICPVCGKKNKDLYLDETGGWMECDGCYAKVKVRESGTTVRIPVFTTEQFIRLLKDGKFAAGQLSNLYGYVVDKT